MRRMRILIFGLFLAVVAMAPIYAHAMLRIEVCGGQTDERQCKPGIDEIANTGEGGSVDIGCSPGDPVCTVKDQKIQVNSKAALPTPDGWTPAVSPSVEPTPPATATPINYNPDGDPALPDPSLPSNCSAFTPGVRYFQASLNRHIGVFSNGFPQTHPTPPDMNPIGLCSHSGFPSGNSAYFATPANPPFCPPGYTNSGGVCNLSNAALVMKPSDGTCTIKRDGNSFTGDSRDPDCALNPGVSISGSSLTINPVSGSVENKKIEFQPDGSGSITSSKPNADGTTTERKVTFGSPDGATGKSTVTGTGERVYRGTGDQKGSAVGEIPTDYNRETTQQGIKGLLETLRDGLTGSGVPDGAGATDGANDALDSASSSRESSLTDVIGAGGKDTGWGFTFTVPTEACEPIEIWDGHEIDICQQAEPLRSFLAFIWYMTTAWLIISMVGTALRGG